MCNVINKEHDCHERTESCLVVLHPLNDGDGVVERSRKFKLWSQTILDVDDDALRLSTSQNSDTRVYFAFLCSRHALCDDVAG